MSVRDVARLDRELGARPRGSRGVRGGAGAGGVRLPTDPVAAKTWVEAELLDELVDCHEALGRVDEAITVMRRALQVGWAGRPDGRCRIAELLMRDGRIEQATEIWEQVRVDTPDDVYLYNNAGPEYADVGDHRTALTWLTQGLQLAIATGDPEVLVEQLADLHREAMTELGRGGDPLQRDAAQFLAHPPPAPVRPWPAVAAAPSITRSAGWPPGGASARAAARSPIVQDSIVQDSIVQDSIVQDSIVQDSIVQDIDQDIDQDPWHGSVRTPVAFAWFPAADYSRALRRWPELTEQGPAREAADHAAYNLARQRTLLEYADSGFTRLHVAAVRVEPFLGWCRRAGRDPSTAAARSRYAAELLRLGDPGMVAWPPGRNQRWWWWWWWWWCGSGRKYKLCCGSVAR